MAHSEKFRKINPDKMSEMMPSKDRKFYPRLHLDLADLPEAKGWKIGSKYYLALELVQKSMEQSEGNDGKQGSVGFEIHGLKVLKHQGGKASSRDADE